VSPIRRLRGVRQLLLAAPVVAALWVAPAAAADLLPPQMHTVAGGGTCSGSVTPVNTPTGPVRGPCDGIAATSAQIEDATSVAALPGGGFLYVDWGNKAVREVSPLGIVTTVAGTGTQIVGNQTVPSTTDVDCGPATASGLDDPVAVAALPDGGFLITEHAGERVRMVSPDGTISTVAGIPPAGSGSCDAPVSESTALSYPDDAVPTAAGGALIADTGANSVMLLPALGGPNATLTQIAGGLDQPAAVSEIPGGSGAYLVADTGADTVSEVSGESPGAAVTTVAGQSGSAGSGGSGGPATAAQLNAPEGVTALSGGGFLIADTGDDTVREVSPTGVITTIAGQANEPFDTGDGGAATAAQLDGPTAVAPTINGGILIADDSNNAIREITLAPVSTVTLTPSSPNGRNGWYTTKPQVYVSATEDATVACVLDPGQAPPVYAAIVPGCTYAVGGSVISGNGPHTLYVASENSFGDDENPISVALKLDTTRPTVTCKALQSFRYGQRNAIVSATLRDGVSGPAKRGLVFRVNTHRPGTRKVTMRGTDLAGLRGSARCKYRVGARPRSRVKKKKAAHPRGRGVKKPA